MRAQSRNKERMNPQFATKSSTKTAWNRQSTDSEPTAANARKPVSKLEKTKSQYLLIARSALVCVPLLCAVLVLIKPTTAESAIATWQEITIMSVMVVFLAVSSLAMLAVLLLGHKERNGGRR